MITQGAQKLGSHFIQPLKERFPIVEYVKVANASDIHLIWECSDCERKRVYGMVGWDELPTKLYCMNCLAHTNHVLIRRGYFRIAGISLSS